jgi:hypothetical protein
MYFILIPILWFLQNFLACAVWKFEWNRKISLKKKHSVQIKSLWKPELSSYSSYDDNIFLNSVCDFFS